MSSQSSRHAHFYDEINCDSLANLSLLDPPRWGWSALGGITDLLPPHERARRLRSQRDFQTLKYREKKRRAEQENLKEATSLPPTGRKACDVPTSDTAKNMLGNNDSSENILKDQADYALIPRVDAEADDIGFNVSCSSSGRIDGASSKNDVHLQKENTEGGLEALHDKDHVSLELHPHGHSSEGEVVDDTALLELNQVKCLKGSNENVTRDAESSEAQVPVKCIVEDTAVVESSEVNPIEENIPLVPMAMQLANEIDRQGVIVVDSSRMSSLGERIQQDTAFAEPSGIQPPDKSDLQDNLCTESGKVQARIENIHYHSVVAALNEVQPPEKNILQGPASVDLGGVNSMIGNNVTLAIVAESNEVQLPEQSFLQGPLSADGAVNIVTNGVKPPETSIQKGAVKIVTSVVQPQVDNFKDNEIDDVVDSDIIIQAECVPESKKMLISPDELPIGDHQKVSSFDDSRSKSLDSNSFNTNVLKKKSSKSIDYNFGPNYNVIQKPKGRSKRDKFDIEVKAVKQDGSVHLDAYHRGIVGEEPRCRSRGNLLCDTEPTDTNHGWDEPHLKLSVKVEFPLCDPEWSDDEIGEDSDSVMDDFKEDVKASKRDKRHREGRKYLSETEKRIKREERMKSMPYFCENVEWDLSNPKTPTPILYAADIAAEFGLSFCSMLDLARSIQSQIDTFLRDNVNYHAPISVKDHLLAPRGKNSLQPPKYSHPKILYGGHCATDITTASKYFEAVESKKERSSSYDGKKHLVKRKNIKLKHSISHNVPTSKCYNNKTGHLTDQLLENSDYDETHVQEFLQRAKMENQRITQKLADGNIGTVKVLKNMNCHFCHKRRSKGIQFICGTESHSFCDMHTIKRFGLSVDDLVSKGIDFCPVCCLECTCCRCKSKLLSLVPMFVKECKKQGLCSSDVKFDFTFHCNRSLWKLETSDVKNSTTSSCSRLTNDKTVKISHRGPEQVPKIPKDDFPAEMTHGINRDPSMKDDYNTIFTPEGAIVCDDVITNSKEESASTAVEDANVDYCSECQRTGDIICCDVCPRGFHAVCLGLDTSALAGRWECPRCLQDSTQQTQDLVEGTYYLDKLKIVFEQFSNTSDFEQKVRTLSKIFDAIKLLTEYEFGNIFSEPVDVKVVRDYKKYVKRPMDLGTITSKLLKGSYCKSSSRTKDLVGADKTSEMDVVILNVLKDIEQIWNNCFLYNREGSSFYRMGQVLQRKFSVIRRASFEKELNSFVRQNLNIFVDECNAKRQDLSNSLKPWIPKSKYHINISNKGPANKTIAIFDKDTKMVVKQYTSITSACYIAEFLSNLGHKSEIETASKTKVREYIMSMQENPSLLLFGYRWLLMDNLRSGNFKLEDKPSSAIIQKKCKISKSVLEEFDSLECAYESWLSAINICVSILQLKDFARNVDYFLRHFLDGNSTVDSVEWVRINAPVGPKATVVDITNPNRSEHNFEERATSELMKNCSDGNVMSLKDSIDAGEKRNDVKPNLSGCVETGKRSLQSVEDQLMTRHGNQSSTQVSCHGHREDNTSQAVTVTYPVNTVEVGLCDNISSAPASELYTDTVQNTGKTANSFKNDHSYPNSSKCTSVSILDSYNIEESAPTLPPKVPTDINSSTRVVVSQQNKYTKTQSGGNPADDSIKNCPIHALSTAEPSSVSDVSNHIEATQSLSAREATFDTGTSIGMASAMFDIPISNDESAQSFLRADIDDSYHYSASGMPRGTSETSKSHDSAQRVLDTAPLLGTVNDLSFGVSSSVLETSNNKHKQMLSGIDPMFGTVNDNSIQNESVNVISDALGISNNVDSSQRLVATEPAFCDENDNSCQNERTVIPPAVVDAPDNDKSLQSLLVPTPITNTGNDHSYSYPPSGICTDMHTSNNDERTQSLLGTAPMIGTGNSISYPNMPSSRMSPCVFDTLNNNNSSQRLSSTEPMIYTRSESSKSNTSSSTTCTMLDVSNTDEPSQMLLGKEPTFSTRNDYSYPHTSSGMCSGIFDKSSNKDYTQRLPGTEPISTILDTSNNNESTQRMFQTGQIIGVGNDYSYCNSSTGMTSGMLDTSSINQSTQRLSGSVPIYVTGNNHPYQHVSSSMNTVSQILVHNQFQAPSPRVLILHQNALQGNVPVGHNNRDSLRSEISGPVQGNSHVIGIRATHQQSDSSLKSNEPRLETRAPEPSALEVETVASLLDFSRVGVPSTSLGKRPVDDSERSIGITQSKRQHR